MAGSALSGPLVQAGRLHTLGLLIVLASIADTIVRQRETILEHAVVMVLKYGFKEYIVNPHTSKIGEAGKDLGLDKHTGSAYMLVPKYIGVAK